jgi:hypothetical protein
MKNLSAELGGVGGGGSDVADSALPRGTNSHACTFFKEESP